MSLLASLRSPSSPGPLPAALHIPATNTLPLPTAGVFPPRNLPPVTSRSLLLYHAIHGGRTREYIDVIESGVAVPVIEWKKKNVENDRNKISDKIRELVGVIRSMLRSMDDGEISVSAYDTAWVALVEDIDGGGAPQFPSSLDWISNNQHDDGSWGDRDTFSAHDRIINTLACVVALRYWKLHPHKSDKGISFIRENINKLEDENEEQMPIGFEVALPSLIEIAKSLSIHIPCHNSPALQHIHARRDLKLQRIPWDIMHQVPTTLLHSLEGMPALDWQKLLKLQCADGSFLFSPSSTAFALHQTKDQNCLNYLLNHVQKFNGGVPNVYPVDLFERLWAVDRLQRLGISRYFQHEIDECIDYVHRYWTSRGICWARNSEVQDIDDTAMGFRLLRLHGYQVSADVFKHFENGGEFFCFVGQSDQAVTGMYNLYRASHLMFPGEDILADARNFSANFLQEKRASNELLDKWIIAKDLPGEVGYALDVPWYASLPRLETRFFLEQYGGDDEVWIGKTLYRMPYVNNNTYLELAKLDYNNCQALHQQEWKSVQKWCRNCGLGEFGLSERSLLLAYYIAAVSIFEPEKSGERLAWAKTVILVETIVSHFDRQQLSREQKRNFVNEFEHGHIVGDANGGRYKTRKSLVGILIRTVSEVSMEAGLAHGKDIYQELNHAWQKWLRTWEELGADDTEQAGDAELFVQTLNLSGGGSSRVLGELLLSHPKYQQLRQVTTRVCHHLRLFQNRKVQEGKGCVSEMGGTTTVQIESDMQELVKLVLTQSSRDLDYSSKQNFLVVARSFITLHIVVVQELSIPT
ncbi:Kolavenyl diphosphate synthase TPS5, chloroplastic [Sesamum alatum]|uniref:Kolavenyl diphosphate synthase TPS5, chloroplastic n=1 Tax=Sesamum alatum TaxID=300844 RepID=A0AAE2D0T7_9LAMI|nr:Kolavenyl diphosphate synthase TPS5, chloroplastic [Sesamum alatum]